MVRASLPRKGSCSSGLVTWSLLAKAASRTMTSPRPVPLLFAAVQGRSSFFFGLSERSHVSQPSKIFKSHGEQIDLLRSRGMHIGDEAVARRVLERVNYYRLSGYWYSFRELSPDGDQRLDTFVDDTSFGEVLSLYEFDERLRAGVFTCLTPIELAIRSALGHELGRIDPQIHLKPELLGPVARQPGPSAEPSATYKKWKRLYDKEVSLSREDFVAHHKKKYSGQLPIWAAVEIIDWGSLSYLYQLAPIDVRDTIAAPDQAHCCSAWIVSQSTKYYPELLSTSCSDVQSGLHAETQTAHRTRRARACPRGKRHH